MPRPRSSWLRAPAPGAVRHTLLLLAMTGMLLPRTGLAQPVAGPSAQERARAEVLFREARDLMTEEKLAEACPKFAESHQLDPAAGTLLNLAVCHEKDGKLVSAWTEFLDAELLAKKAGQLDRASYAHNKAEALQSQMSYVRVVVPVHAQAAGLELRLDGSPLQRSSWGTKLPVDPGEHVIEASAPGYKSSRDKLPVGKGPTLATFQLSPLEPLPATAAAPVIPAPVTETAPVTLAPMDPQPAGSAPGQTQRIAGYITAGVGVIGLGLGTGFGVHAMSLKRDRDAQCDGLGCTAAGLQSDKDARSSGTLSTVTFIAGGALLAGGVALVLTAPKAGPRASLSVSPRVGGGCLHTEMSW